LFLHRGAAGCIPVFRTRHVTADYACGKMGFTGGGIPFLLTWRISGKHALIQGDDLVGSSPSAPQIFNVLYDADGVLAITDQ
jgi:hypothetical protein